MLKEATTSMNTSMRKVIHFSTEIIRKVSACWRSRDNTSNPSPSIAPISDATRAASAPGSRPMSMAEASSARYSSSRLSASSGTVTQSLSYSGWSIWKTALIATGNRRYAAAGLAGLMRPTRRGAYSTAADIPPGRRPVWSATPTDSCAAANVSAPTCASVAYAPSIITGERSGAL